MNIPIYTNRVLQLATAGSIGLSILGLSSPKEASAASIQEMAAVAQQIAPQYGLYPSVMAAQAILESGYGKSSLATNYNNYFGIKGAGVSLKTVEYLNGAWVDMIQSFKIYNSIYDSFSSNGALLYYNSIYYGTHVANTNSYKDATAALQGVYATDPGYSAKLNKIIEEYGLSAYDYNYGYSYGSQTTETSYATSTSYQTSESNGGNYTVKSGDSLWAISQKYGTSVDQLMANNNLSTDTLMIGQTLYV
ncbi:glucosaminidase domain-containing protein [Streptococcaceae bacterium ESL0687]|nr:glucosaminidase domain-containing protein [Streptococcaceae bacterium ESL0687]